MVSLWALWIVRVKPIEIDVNKSGQSKYNSNARNSMESWTAKIKKKIKKYMALLLRDEDIHKLSYFCENFISSHLLYSSFVWLVKLFTENSLFFQNTFYTWYIVVTGQLKFA